MSGFGVSSSPSPSSSRRKEVFLSPEPLTPIDNNPPDESSIGHGGGQDIHRAPKGDPTHHHTKERVRTQRATTPSQRPQHPKRTADLSKNSTRCLHADPTGDHSDATCRQNTPAQANRTTPAKAASKQPPSSPTTPHAHTTCRQNTHLHKHKPTTRGSASRFAHPGTSVPDSGYCRPIAHPTPLVPPPPTHTLPHQTYTTPPPPSTPPPSPTP